MSFDNFGSKIYVAGHNGLVGRAIVRKLRSLGYFNIIYRSSSQLDLRNQLSVEQFFHDERPEFVFLAAAKVGGIKANVDFTAEAIYDNLMIQCNIIHSSYKFGVKKLLFLGSSCIYPKECPQPIKESYLMTGPLEKTNDSYAVAKIAGIQMCQAYNRQYKTNFISCMPTNLYGPYDNFDLETSHVLPALIAKFVAAKKNNASSVTLWGDGTPLREFLHVDDMADACIFLMKNYNKSEIVNIGTGKDISIKQVAEIIGQVVGFQGSLEFDTSKPNGTMKKQLNTSFMTSLGWSPKISLQQGIQSTVEWFLNNGGLELTKSKSRSKKRKVALIFGVTGQDGSYLAELLIDNGYEVHGVKRRSSSLNTQRVDHLYQDPHNPSIRFKLHYGDLSDGPAILKLIGLVQPDEIYNLAAQSHVKVSFGLPTYTGDVVALGATRILDAIRSLGLERKTRYYQASSSEMFGKVKEIPQKETTPFHPRSPYAVAKVYAYWVTVNYRESYGLYACNGILFNHESPRRGETFVSRKITRSVAAIKLGLQDVLYIGNLESKRDWGYARDYVEAMWLMLQQEKPADFVISTGRTVTVRKFLEDAFSHIGIKIEWRGRGLSETGHDSATGKLLVKVDPRYFRPAEVDLLIGDCTKAKTELGWKPKVNLEQLIKMMVDSDLEQLSRDPTPIIGAQVIQSSSSSSSNSGTKYPP